LHHRTLAPEADAATPLLLLHGLFGSSANWGGVAKQLASDRRVLMPDLRNHGRSLWAAPMDYPEMAADLVRLLDATGIDRAHLVGHSMGGKAAMWLALCAPRRVARLVVVDIAPVAYAPRFGEMIAAMRALPLAEIGSRGRCRRSPRRGDSVPIGARLSAAESLSRTGVGLALAHQPGSDRGVDAGDLRVSRPRRPAVHRQHPVSLRQSVRVRQRNGVGGDSGVLPIRASARGAERRALGLRRSAGGVRQRRIGLFA
jgi:pimeloyl-ACP methyl ester carboxylesterase